MTDTAKAEVIIDQVCDCFHKPYNEIRMRIRKRVLVEPRQFAQMYLKKYTNFTLREIGWLVGNPKHCNVIHSIKTADNLTRYKEYAEKHEQMTAGIRSGIIKINRSMRLKVHGRIKTRRELWGRMSVVEPHCTRPTRNTTWIITTA